MSYSLGDYAAEFKRGRGKDRQKRKSRITLRQKLITGSAIGLGVAGIAMGRKSQLARKAADAAHNARMAGYNNQIRKEAQTIEDLANK